MWTRSDEEFGSTLHASRDIPSRVDPGNAKPGYAMVWYGVPEKSKIVLSFLASHPLSANKGRNTPGWIYRHAFRNEPSANFDQSNPARLSPNRDLGAASVAAASVRMSYILHLAPFQLCRVRSSLWHAEKPGRLSRQVDFGKIYYTRYM